MAKTIAICGDTGEGKTTSLQNLPPKETVIITPYKLELPFANSEINYTKYDQNTNPNGNFIYVPKLQEVESWIKYVATARPDINYIVLEDFTHYLTAYILTDDFKVKGSNGKTTWSRWEDLATDAFKSLFALPPYLRDNLWIICIFHSEVEEKGLSSKRIIKIPSGEMINKKINIQSYFNTFLFTTILPFDRDAGAEYNSSRFKYVIINDGYNVSKIPAGVFPPDLYEIDADIFEVIKKLEEFYKNHKKN